MTRMLPRTPRRIKQVVWKFVHCRRLTPRERDRLVHWIHGRHRAIGAPPMRQLPDGRYSLFDLWP